MLAPGYVCCCSRLRSSISPSPTQTLLSGNESPGTEPLLGAAAAAAGQPAQVYISSGSNAQMQPQSNNLILRGQNRNKRPPPCPSPQAKPQNLSSTAASSSSSNIQASPRRSSSSNATWVPQVSSSSNLAAYSSPVGSSSSLWAGNSRVLGYSTGPGGLAGSGGGVSPGVLASSYGGLAYGSSGSRRHQQLLSNALQSASPSPTGEGLLAASLNLSPASAAAAAAVGEAVTAVAGNPHHPHHQQTMQLLLQHQQLQMHHLQQQQLQQAAVDIPGRLGGGFLYPVGDYYGSVGAQPLPQSPEVLLRRSSSSSRWVYGVVVLSPVLSSFVMVQHRHLPSPFTCRLLRTMMHTCIPALVARSAADVTTPAHVSCGNYCCVHYTALCVTSTCYFMLYTG